MFSTKNRGCIPCHSDDQVIISCAVTLGHLTSGGATIYHDSNTKKAIDKLICNGSF